MLFQKRDEIKAIIRDVLKHHTTDHWLSLLHKHHLWAAEVKDWKQLSQHEGYKVLGMEQEIRLQDHSIITTRCPIRIDGEKLYVNKPAPALGKDTEKIKNELA
jgi:Predicted acyl-CoA transferases/carnitine dehydratase